MRDRTRVRAYHHPWGENIQILITDHKFDKVFIGKEVRFEEGNPALSYEPTLYLQRDDAQELMDSLWDCGLRPTEGTGSAGSLAATQRHLDDMRKLVFDFLMPKK